MSRKVVIASAIWGASILLSRLIGLVREAVLGRILGGGSEADVYFVAFTIPDFLNHLLAGGALSIVFIPMFGGYLARGEESRGWESFSVIANALLLFMTVALALLWWQLPALAPVVAPGFDPTQTARLITLTRIILPAQIFHLVGGLLSAALQAKEKHALPALAPLLYTLGVIAGGLAGGRTAGAEGFAWGVLAGSFAGPFALPLLGLLGAGLRWAPILKLRHPDLRTYILRSLPIVLAFSVVVADDWILRRFGSLVGEGAVSTMNYAKQLMRVPMGVFGMAAGVGAFPTLTRLIASGDRKGAGDLLWSTMRHMLALSFAAQVALTSCGMEISSMIYGSRIPPEQHAAIHVSLALFGIGLWGWAAQTLLSRGFYALGNTWLPSVIGTAAVAVAYPLYSWWGDRWSTAGMAVASSLAITLYVLALLWLLRRSLGGTATGNAAFFARILPATAAGLAAGLAGRTLFPIDNPAISAMAYSAAGCGTYLGAAVLLRVQEVSDTLKLLRARLIRIPPLG